MNKILFFFLCVILMLGVVSCSGPQTGRVSGSGNIAYGNADEVETVTLGWSSTDLQLTTTQMTQSLLNSKWINLAQQPPKVRLREVKNLTLEHIDTKSITDKIRIQLLNSGQVRFLADVANLEDVYQERDLAVSTTTRDENLLMQDTDYIITGTVRSINKRDKKTKDVFYLITMELVDPQSGEIMWADEKEIRKTQEKGFFGW